MKTFACKQDFGEYFTIDAKNLEEAQLKCDLCNAVVIEEIVISEIHYKPMNSPHLHFDSKNLVDEIVPVLKEYFMDTIYDRLEDKNLAEDIQDDAANYIYKLVIKDLS